jgi:proteasome accessory factor A
VFTGAGKVGAENGRPPVDYQLTQRADFFEEEVGLETTLKRPIINTRDEPHADPTRYRRLHVIIGDANLSELQILMKLGVTSVMLAAITAGTLGPPVILDDPVDALWRISHDPTLQTTVRIVDGGTATALDLQWHYFEWLAKHVEMHGTTDANLAALGEWEAVLGDLERDPLLTADRLDWTAKLRLLEAYRQRDGLRWTDPKLRMLDLQYHDVDRERSLHRRLTDSGRMRRLFSDEELHVATLEPPPDTRAWFRGRCVEKYGEAIVAANWDSLIFDVGEESLRRVPMMDPQRGTRRLTAELLERAPHAADLIQALEEDTRR